MLDQPEKRGAPDKAKEPALDFQQHLAALEAAGLVTRIDRPIDKDAELHPLVRWQFVGGVPEDKRRAFLFTNVVDGSGKRYDMPVVVGALSANPQIYAIGMGKPVEDIGQAWLDAVAHPIPPVRVTSAPCQEVVIKGDELRKPDGGLKLLPVPISTPGFDAAPYFTATLCVTKDPESGIQNMGTYRAGLKATDRLGVRMASRIGGAGGYQHWLKHRKLKTPMPVAIVVGCAPVVTFTGPQKLAIDMDEMGVAGALAGEPIRTVKCVTVDLDVPADSEIVIEGLVDPELLEPEGPFGESHGYIALEDYNMSMQVTAITHKKKPVFVSIISQVTPSESSVIKKVAYEPMFLSHLRDHLGIKGIRAVSLHEPLSNVRPVIFLQVRAGRAAHRSVARAARRIGIARRLRQDRRRGLATTSTRPTPMRCSGRWPIAPTRSTMCMSCLTAPAATARSPAACPNDSSLLIDATLKQAFPPLALPTREFMERARKIWDELDLPALSPQPPWHGYTLGDWNETWETYAKRAVAGAWEQSGEETFAQKRGGMTPETPVRDAGQAG